MLFLRFRAATKEGGGALGVSMAALTLRRRWRFSAARLIMGGGAISSEVREGSLFELSMLLRCLELSEDDDEEEEERSRLDEGDDLLELDRCSPARSILFFSVSLRECRRASQKFVFGVSDTLYLSSVLTDDDRSEPLGVMPSVSPDPGFAF
jgi:hypothetical protein